MPTKTRSRKNVLRAGQGAAPDGRQGQKPVRRIGQEGAPAAAVVAGSLHSLILQPIASPDVDRRMLALGPSFSVQRRADQLEQMLKDLWLSYRAAMRRYLDIQVSVTTHLPDRGSLGATLQALVELFKRDIVPLFPEGSEFNIDHSDYHGRYYFTVYKVCKWGNSWQTLALKHIFRRLRKQRHKALHDLFLSFLNAFCDRTGVNIWFDGSMSIVEEWMENEMEQLVSEAGDLFGDDEEFSANQERIGEFQQTAQLYKFGQAAKYADRILKSPKLTVDEIRARLKRIRRDHPVRRIIAAGCNLMEEPYHITDFNYNPYDHDQAQFDGLRYRDQAQLLWDWDLFTEQYTGWIDDLANNVGTMEPSVKIHLDAGERNWPSLERFTEASRWPWAIYHFFQFANTQAEKA